MPIQCNLNRMCIKDALHYHDLQIKLQIFAKSKLKINTVSVIVCMVPCFLKVKGRYFFKQKL